MPGEFDGFGLLQRIVRTGEENGVGVIMMSGDGNTATKGDVIWVVRRSFLGVGSVQLAIQ